MPIPMPMPMPVSPPAARRPTLRAALGARAALVLTLLPGLPASAQQAPPAAPASTPAPALPVPTLTETRLDVHSFQVVERESGAISYYHIVEDPSEPFIRAMYRPPLETVVVGIQVPDALRQGALRLRWKWRAMALPKGGDECTEGKGDSAAAVYVSWKSGLRWWSLKYVWSTAGKQGTRCTQIRNFLTRQDAVILRSGGPTGVWVTEEVDPAAEFRAHFEGGDPKAEVPDLFAVGVMSDGDQTRSASGGDFTRFAILH